MFEWYLEQRAHTQRTDTDSYSMSPTEAVHAPLANQPEPAPGAAAAEREHAQEAAAAAAASSAVAAAQPDMAAQQAALQLQALADVDRTQSQAAAAAVPAALAHQGLIAAEPELPQHHGAEGTNAEEPEEPGTHCLSATEAVLSQPNDETLRILAPAAAVQAAAPAAVSPASVEEILDLGEVSVAHFGELAHGPNPHDDAMWINIEQERAEAVKEDEQTHGEKRQVEEEVHSEDVQSEEEQQQGRQAKRVKLEGSIDGEGPRSRKRLLQQLAE